LSVNLEVSVTMRVRRTSATLHELSRSIKPIVYSDEFRRPPKIVAFCILFAVSVFAPRLVADDLIPKAAWKRPLGLPLENAGIKMTTLERKHIDEGYWQGAPVGGFGAGTFSRTYRGDFARWHLKTGVSRYQSVPFNRFGVYEKADGEEPVVSTLYAGESQASGSLSKFDYPIGAGDYYALYPKAWYDYGWDKLPVRLTLEQFSPILPNNYKETSYPVAVYEWHAQNLSKKKVTVSVMLTWANMLGWFQDRAPNFSLLNNMTNVNQTVAERISHHGEAATMRGIVFDRVRRGDVVAEGDGQFVIAALDSPQTQVSYVTTFGAGDSDPSVWSPFAAMGKLPNSELSWVSSGETLGGAIAVTFVLEPGEKLTVPMVISWDLPIVEFGSGRKWLRHYTDFFGSTGTHAWEIAKEGFLHEEEWSDAIDAWQKPIVEDESKPLWYRGALFNEMYILADGGTLWGRPLGADRNSPAAFAYLEGFDYQLYSSLDVLYYGSMPLVKWWPNLDKEMMRAFAEGIPKDLTEKSLVRSELIRNQRRVFRARKAKGAVPHDLGNPEEDPIVYISQYGWQDTNRWKDLNAQFVLMVYRDYVLTGGTDLDFLKSTWPAVRESLQYLRQFDRDGGGIPQNEGIADQTYDNWPAHGQMAYCGGLWLAALRSAEEIAKKLGEEKIAKEYRSLFELSQKTYLSKLWNGHYFRYDAESEYRDSIHADQLSGQLYANLLGLGALVPKEMRMSSLRNIFANNVMKFANGDMGAVNGMTNDGALITSNEQVQEVWAGTTYALAAEMLAEGMRDEAFHTARGAYYVTYETKGYWFRTPEAWDIAGKFRASMAMRPGAIWALEFVADRNNARSTSH
jgi:non-lysosomal glucosylceramidase